MIFSSNNSFIRPSMSASLPVRLLLSLAWNTMFLTAFTFVGEPLRTLLVEVVVLVLGLALHGSCRTLILHDELSVGRTARSGAACNGNDEGHGSLHGLHTTVDVAANGELSVFTFGYLLGVCHL